MSDPSTPPAEQLQIVGGQRIKLRTGRLNKIQIADERARRVVKVHVACATSGGAEKARVLAIARGQVDRISRPVGEGAKLAVGDVVEIELLLLAGGVYDMFLDEGRSRVALARQHRVPAA